jgi:hypothetical protein
MILAQKKAVEVAQYLVDQYGAGAEREASLRAEALAQMGNLEAAKIWSELGETVERLRSPRKRAKPRSVRLS